MPILLIAFMFAMDAWCDRLIEGKEMAKERVRDRGLEKDVGGKTRAHCDIVKVKLTCGRLTRNQGLVPCSLDSRVGMLSMEDEVLTAT